MGGIFSPPKPPKPDMSAIRAQEKRAQEQEARLRRQEEEAKKEKERQEKEKEARRRALKGGQGYGRSLLMGAANDEGGVTGKSGKLGGGS